MKNKQHCKAVIAAIGLLAMTGCTSSLSPDIVYPGALPYPGESGAQVLAQQITVTNTMPPEAYALGTVTAARCHRGTGEAEPTEETVLMDMRDKAYKQGAIGISSVTMSKGFNLANNCQWTIKGSGQMYGLAPRQGSKP